jgi:hypothetical protein
VETKRGKLATWVVLVVLALVTLNLLACDIGGDMDRAWMTQTVEAAIVIGDGR